MRDIIKKLEELNVEKPQLNEGLGELAHEAEKDHEVQMARSDCYKSAKYAVAIHKMLKDISEMEGIDGWVAAKITKAADYLGSVKHYMEGQAMSDVELAVVPVAGDMTDAMTVPQESIEEVHEAEERTYIVVHAKHGKEEIKASSSYAAAKKYAEMKKLKSTAGVDAHLADKEKTATESIEEAAVTENPAMDLLKKMPQNAATAAMQARKASDLEKNVKLNPLNIDKGKMPYSINNKYVGKDAIVKMINDPNTDPIDFDDIEARWEWENRHKPVASRAEYDAAVLKNKAALKDAGIDYDDTLAKAGKYHDTKDGKASMQAMGINDEDDLIAYLMQQAGIEDQTPDQYTISQSGDATTKYTSALASLKKNEDMSDDEIDDFHKELDDVVHKHLGHSSDEEEEMNEEDVIGDIIDKLNKMGVKGKQPNKPRVSMQQQQKQANSMALPKPRPDRSMAQDTTVSLDKDFSMRTAKANQKAMQTNSKFSEWSKK